MALIVCCLVSLALVSCGGGALTSQDIPLPEGASSSIGEGPFEIRLDNISLDVRSLLGDRFGSTAIQQYQLPEAMTWDVVLAFYRERLESGGWTAIPELSGEHADYQVASWSRGVGLSQQQGLAVGYIARDDELPANILLIVLSTP